MKRLIPVAIATVAGCEYRDRATDLSFEQQCYLLEKAKSITVRVQARNGEIDGVDGIRVQWAVAPIVLAPEPTVATTAGGRVEGFATEGIAVTTITLAEDTIVTLPAVAVVTASAAIDDALLTATAELRLSADGEDTACSDNGAVDAGVDAPAD